MNWFDIPGLVFLLTLAFTLQPRRRWSHYCFALCVSTIAGVIATGLTLIVWGITR
ncbi:hypothetical protein [Marinobacter algicola]|uniref:hypothetical protein n=1 Tax=Marinobacter algicola TaxID=236100 RepID=UPI0012F47928|nr:hypothetical protein [Marinobacter algicola]